MASDSLVENPTECVGEIQEVNHLGDMPKQRKCIPPPLNITNDITSELRDRLTEFAIFATSPRSPLVQKNLPIRKRAYSFPSTSAFHSYAARPSTPPSMFTAVLSPPSSQPSPLSNSLEELGWSGEELTELDVPQNVFETISSDFTPEDTNAIFALSSMAKHKNFLATPLSPPSSPTKRSFDRAKRPMNGFMLFAKKFRLEYTHLHPGKDNRAISVLLGDTWRKMTADERNTYADEARLLAEKQKLLHPDCWKRKRSLSTT